MNEFMILAAVIIIICVLLNKISNKFGIPVLLAFLLLGMFATIIDPESTSRTQMADIEKICSVALIFIMFYGGFGTRLESARSVLLPSGILATLGVAVTAGCVGLCCHFVLKWPWVEAMMIGAVISSTDAASVFSILRSRRLGLRNNTAPMLEIESGSNDPMSYMLTMVMLSVMQGTASGAMMVKLILLQFLVGAAIGFALAYIFIYLFNYKFKLGSTGFDSVLFFAIAMAAYAIPSLIGGNGYLSVYIVGIMLGNYVEFSGKKSVVSFLDGITSMMQILIFYILGTMTNIHTLHRVALPALAIFAFITFIGRPVAVFSGLSPWWRRFPFKQKLLVSFVGLRGAASIVFAMMVISDIGISPSHDLFNIVFCIVLISILLQGSLIPLVSKKLDMIDAHEDVLKTFSDFSEESEMTFGTIELDADSPWKDKMVRDLNLPKNLLLTLIIRGKRKIVPKGNTTLHDGDIVITCTKAYGNNSDNISQHRVSKQSIWAGHAIKELPYKENIVVILINRGNERIIPNGNTILQENDLLTMLELEKK